MKVRLLETLRTGYACSEVGAKERCIALDLHRQVASGVVCEGTVLRHVAAQVREVGYLRALSDDARRCECSIHWPLVTSAARWGRQRGAMYLVSANRRRRGLFAEEECFDM